MSLCDQPLRKGLGASVFSTCQIFPVGPATPRTRSPPPAVGRSPAGAALPGLSSSMLRPVYFKMPTDFIHRGSKRAEEKLSD